MKTETIKVQIPDGWELVTEEVAEIKHWSYFIKNNGELIGVVYPRIELRKVEEWKQPDFLKPGWIAMDANGKWCWYGDEPSHHSNAWNVDDGGILYLGQINWTPPACDDWRKSKRRID